MAFAELEQFIDAPVKNYSSGMYMRLGFAVAIHVDPDVLLVDEVLAVGDEAFTRKCLDKIGEFRRRGRTIVIVTHSLGLVDKMCDEALWLRDGEMVEQGDPKRVVDAYLIYVAGGEENLLAAEREAAPERLPESTPDEDEAEHGYREGRWGAREIEIERVRLLDDGGAERHVYVPGEDVTVALDVVARDTLDDFVFGIGIFTADGVNVFGTNTHVEEFAPLRAEGTGQVRIVLEGLSLVEGTYLLDVAAHKRDGTPYDYLRGRTTFRIKSRVKDVGVYRPAHRWEFTGGSSSKRHGPGPRSTCTGSTSRTRDAAGPDPPRRPRRAAPRVEGRGRGGGLYERVLRPAAPRPPRAARAGAGRGTGSRRGDQLGRLRGSPEGSGAPRRPRGRAGRDASGSPGRRSCRRLRRADAARRDRGARSRRARQRRRLGTRRDRRRDVVEAAGGRVLRVELLDGRSTSGLIEKIKQQ